MQVTSSGQSSVAPPPPSPIQPGTPILKPTPAKLENRPVSPFEQPPSIRESDLGIVEYKAINQSRICLGLDPLPDPQEEDQTIKCSSEQGIFLKFNEAKALEFCAAINKNIITHSLYKYSDKGYDFFDPAPNFDILLNKLVKFLFLIKDLSSYTISSIKNSRLNQSQNMKDRTADHSFQDIDLLHLTFTPSESTSDTILVKIKIKATAKYYDDHYAKAILPNGDSVSLRLTPKSEEPNRELFSAQLCVGETQYCITKKLQEGSTKTSIDQTENPTLQTQLPGTYSVYQQHI